MNEKKRSVGRPRTGKIKMLISLSPALVKTIDDNAALVRMSRSDYLEVILRLALDENKTAPHRD